MIAHRKWIKWRVFAGVLVIAAILRWLFLAEFPYAFGHSDSPQYSGSILRLLQDGVFVPDVFRVNAAYVFLTAYWLKLFGGDALSVAFFQHILGLVSGVLVFSILKSLTRQHWISCLGMAWCLFLPRSILFEHMILAEALYVFLLLATSLLFIRFFRVPDWKWALACGIFSFFLVVTRGQGILAPIAGVACILYLVLRRQTSVYRGLLFLVLFLVPILSGMAIYRDASHRHLKLNTASIIPSFNLFWVTAGRFTDYTSDLHAEFKEYIRPHVSSSNRQYDGNEEWSIRSDWDVVYETKAFLGDDWNRFHEVLGKVGREAVLTHPLAFSYRVYWNTRKFFVGKKSLDDTIELKDHYVLVDGGRVRMNRAGTLAMRSWTGLEHLQPGNGLVDGILNSIRVDGTAYSKGDGFFSRWIGVARPLTDFNALSAVLFAALILLVGLSIQQGVRGYVLEWFIFFLISGQVLLTMVGSNHLYDRYYSPVEWLIVIFVLSVGMHASQVRGRVWIRVFSYSLSIPALAWIGFQVFHHLPLPYPIVDRPILDLADGWTIQNQRHMIGVYGGLFSILLGLLGMRRLFSRYDRISK